MGWYRYHVILNKRLEYPQILVGLEGPGVNPLRIPKDDFICVFVYETLLKKEFKLWANIFVLDSDETNIYLRHI